MLTIRPAAPVDVPAIDALLRDSFPVPAEARLIGNLCAEGDMVLMLVAAVEDDHAVAGVAAFSRMDVTVGGQPVPSVALVPLAVAADHRQQGVAEALIAAGLERLEAAGVVLCFALGDPAFHARFGFDPLYAKGFASPYAGEFFMAMPLQGGLMPCGVRGEARHPAAFARLRQSA